MSPTREQLGIGPYRANSKYWRPLSRVTIRKRFRNKEAWRRFKATAGIDGRVTMISAYKRTKFHVLTFYRLINGMTDPRLSTAIDFCAVLGCSMDGFARAVAESWEVTGRRIEAEQAMEEARRAETP